MKKKIWIAAGVFILIIGLIGLNVWKKSAEGKITAEVTTLKDEEIVESVMTPGQLELNDFQTVYTDPQKGEISEILVKAGDEIKKGTEIIRYENEQLELEKEQNELQLQSGYLQLNHIREQHNKIDKQIKDAKDNELLLDQLQPEHDQIELQQQQANIEIKQIQLRQEDVERQLKELVVKSDIAGKVFEVNDQAISNSNQLEQQPLIQIGSQDKLIVESTISEYDTMKIKEGQTVTLSSDALPEKTWKGKVSFVSYFPKASDTLGMDGSTSSIQYPIEITIEDKDIGLKPGFQMIAEIQIDKIKSKTLPLTAVLQDGDENYVYIVTADGKAERRNVKVGVVSDEQIAITDGLTGKEQIITSPPENVKTGMDVTVK